MISLTSAIVLGCRDTTPAAGQVAAAVNPNTLRTARTVPGLRAQPLPEPLGGSAPALTRGLDGLDLVWLRDLGEPTLLLAQLPDGEDEWSEPVTVSAGPQLVVSWADVPAVGETRSGRKVVAWPELHTEDPGAGYGVRVGPADDDGSFAADRQWSPDGVRRGPESGFAMFVDSEDGLRMIWLDGRELVGPGGHDDHGADHRGTMQLRTVLLDDEGMQAGPSEILDPRTCECCKLGVAAARGQVFAAYRDRSEAEVRDVHVAGPGLAATLVAADGWTLTGCPVNGPAAAADLASGRAWVGWYTGADERASAWIAASDDLRAGFGARQRFDLGLPGGRVELLALADGDVLISWLELDPANPGLAALLTRRMRADGRLGEPWFVAELGGARDWGFPRAAQRGDEVVWVWTDPTAPDGRPRLQAVAAPVPPLGSPGSGP